VVGILRTGSTTRDVHARTRSAAQEMIALARARGCRVAVSSSDAGDHPEHYLAAGADAVITGAVEPAFLELCQLWTADRSADAGGIAGLALPTASPQRAAAGQLHVLAQQVRRTATRPPLRDLDSLPLPAWDLVDVEVYRALWRAAHGRFSWNMAASRGCPFGCNWCAKPLFGRRYAQRSPREVAAELGRLRAEVAPDHIWFADDIFGLTAPWIRSFADEVSRLRARTPFMIQTRASLMSGATVQALVEAGAEEVWLGVESGSQRILDAMDKGTTVAQIREATRNLKAEGVRVGWFIQLGYLGEVAGRPADAGTDRDRAPARDQVSVSTRCRTQSSTRSVRPPGSKRTGSHRRPGHALPRHLTAAFYRELRDLLTPK
jgi:anaerobic magnesium-protoporphyrin IX monomethyl ester cyclase